MKILFIAVALINLAWDHPTPELATKYELWTWVNNGQVEKLDVTELPTDTSPVTVTKNATIGDSFYAKVRACDDTHCSEWTPELVHVITETQTIVLDRPANIRIEVIVQ